MSVSIPVAAVADLQPGLRSLTSGEPGGELVTVRPLRPRVFPLPLTPRLTLRLGVVSARRFRLYRWFPWIVVAYGLIGLAVAFLAMEADQFAWYWAALGGYLAVSLLYRFLRPAAFPHLDAENDTVRLDHLDPDAVREWVAANGSAGISVLPEAVAAPRQRRYFFGTKGMFFALFGYAFVCMLVAANVFDGGTRDVSVEKEVFSWTSNDRETMKNLIAEAGGVLAVECSGGGRMRLISFSPTGEQKQLADSACDGGRHPVSYPSDQPMFGALGTEFSGAVTAWKVSVTRTVVENESIPIHVPVWTVLYPIGLTALLALVPLEAVLMVRHWRAIPPKQRPIEIDALPEFRGFGYLGAALCVFGLLFGSGMTVMIWMMWSQAT